MNKLISLAVGFGVGSLVGAALVLLFAPTSGETLVKSLKDGYADAMDDARVAAEARRQVLEAELNAKRRTPGRGIQKTN